LEPIVHAMLVRGRKPRGKATMRGGYGNSTQGSLASRVSSERKPESRSPARHCLVEGRESLLVEWRRGDHGWEGRVISVVWVDPVGWATLERWLPASSITQSEQTSSAD
jgi:hypothetical protein